MLLASRSKFVPSMCKIEDVVFVTMIFAGKKRCVKGESNPQLNLGRVPCYHYTIDALFSWKKSIIHNSKSHLFWYFFLNFHKIFVSASLDCACELCTSSKVLLHNHILFLPIIEKSFQQRLMLLMTWSISSIIEFSIGACKQHTAYLTVSVL